MGDAATMHMLLAVTQIWRKQQRFPLAHSFKSFQSTMVRELISQGQEGMAEASQSTVDQEAGTLCHKKLAERADSRDKLAAA